MKQSMVYKDTNLTVTQALDQMISGMSGNTPFNVDCGDCHACCVTYQWTNPLMESVKGEGDKWVCTKLHQCGSAATCSIYADRPPACKHFGCHYQSFGMVNTLLVKHGAPIFVFHIRSLGDLLRAFEVMFSSSILSHGHVFQGEGRTTDIDSFAGYVIGEVSKIRGVLTPDMYDMLPISIRNTLHSIHTLPELYEVMVSDIWTTKPFIHMLRAVHRALMGAQV